MTDINTTINLQIEHDEETYQQLSFLIINGKGSDGYDRINETWKINLDKLIELGIAEKIY